jgi:hypothetical protein
MIFEIKCFILGWKNQTILQELTKCILSQGWLKVNDKTILVLSIASSVHIDERMLANRIENNSTQKKTKKFMLTGIP